MPTSVQNYMQSQEQLLQNAAKEVVDLNKELSIDEAFYLEVFEQTQQYVAAEKLPELNASLESGKDDVLRTVVRSYITKHFPTIFDVDPVVEKCVSDMTGYGFLNQYFSRKDEIEEININAWDTIEVRWCDGHTEFLKEGFHSPQHARNVMSRILRQTGRYLDDNRVYEVSYIGKSVRLTVVITPIVDKEIGVAASIRFIHSAVFTLDKMIENGFMTADIGDDLSAMLSHGVSMCVCGATGSGKTTVCNALLEQIPPQTRVVTLEGGTREFDLIRKDEEGRVLNNRVHMQTRPHKDAKLDVDLQTLLDLVLKFDPDVVVVGEMVSEEAFIASETARTGHTVMTTIHTNNAYDAYYRMYSLGIRKYDLNEKIMLKFMTDAFPIIVYCKKYPDGQRRIQTVLEGWYENGEIHYNELYRFVVEDNIVHEDGSVETVGDFLKVNSPSMRLKDIMLENGASRTAVAAL